MGEHSNEFEQNSLRDQEDDGCPVRFTDRLSWDFANNNTGKLSSAYFEDCSILLNRSQVAILRRGLVS